VSAPVFLLRPLPASDRLVLDGPEGHHAATVRRLRAGERVDLTDGEGELAECVVALVGRDRLEVDVQRRVRVDIPHPRIVVAQALIKGDRSQLAVDLLTEVGVDEIVPWSAERCIVKWVPDRSGRRWEQAAAEAAKQSRRARWPVVGELASTDQLAKRVSAAGRAFVLHEEAELSLVASLDALDADVAEVLLIVGPEGGISPAELDSFTAAGAQAVRLGPSVLRASAAGCAAAAVVLALCGRWK
jgi:16S rRNA (uracil1498-N3)-methyltransferase